MTQILFQTGDMLCSNVLRDKRSVLLKYYCSIEGYIRCESVITSSREDIL